MIASPIEMRENNIRTNVLLSIPNYTMEFNAILYKAENLVFLAGQ
tara:strand:+ start:343 stop:477 length:135 start_codon:yes stop_codon:yes gene_type:complete